MSEHAITEPLLNAKQLAAKLGIPVGTIYSWASKRQMPFVKFPGIGRLYVESQVKAWIDRWSVQPIVAAGEGDS